MYECMHICLPFPSGAWQEAEWLAYLDAHDKLGPDAFKKAVEEFTDQMKPLQQALESTQQRKARPPEALPRKP